MLAFTTSTALAIGALFTGLAAVVTAYAAVVRARGEATAHGTAECEEQLADARAEAEQLARELHDERMRNA